MADTLSIPDDASERDAQRIRQVNRNISIRQQYPKLKRRLGWQQAQEKLAERHDCSIHTVRKVLEGRR